MISTALTSSPTCERAILYSTRVRRRIGAGKSNCISAGVKASAVLALPSNHHFAVINAIPQVLRS